MNLSLFKSYHALVAALLLGTFFAWFSLADFSPGRENSKVTFLLWTGWVAFGFYVLLVLYSVRKHAHRLGLTPEFRMEVPVAKLERAQARLSEIRWRIDAGQLRKKSQIQRAAKRVLKEERVSRILRISVTKQPSKEPPLLLRVGWTQPIAPASKWMHAHIYYGLAAAIMVWLHGGGNFSSPMGFLLNALSYLVIGTGFLGIILWVFGPSWLTRRERDLSIEKAFYLRKHYAHKVVKAAGELQEALVGSGGEYADFGARVGREFKRVARSGSRFAAFSRSLLDELPEGLPKDQKSKVQEVLVLLGQRRNVESEWRALSRVWVCLNVWRVVHVPASILLMVLVVIHIVSVFWY